MNRSIKFLKLSDENYKKTIKNILRDTSCIFYVYDESLEYNFIDLGEIINSVPACVIKDYNIQHNENNLCYKINYHLAIDIFYRFNTLYNFMNYHKIDKMWFIKNGNILMHADIEYSCSYIFNYNK